MQVEDIKVFIPSKEYDKSIEFYKEIGFAYEYVSDDISLFHNGDCYFFLQRFYNQQLAENLMMQLCVSNIEQAYALVQKSNLKTKLSDIRTEKWGRVFYLWGPVGELWHVTQLHQLEN